MVSLIETIKQHMVFALKSGHKEELETLRFILSQISYKQIALQKELVDSDVVALIRKQIKELEETAKQFTAGKRPELAEANTIQIGFLSRYIPKELADSEIKTLIATFIKSHQQEFEANKKSFTGKVIAQFKDRVSPQTLSRIYQDFVI